MTDAPWQGDTVSLVEAFRSGERTPTEELEATLAAAGSSELNAFSHLDADAAKEVAAQADTGLPFGGVPLAAKLGVKVDGWPATEASIPLRDETHPGDGTMTSRLRDAGAVLFGQTTQSEFAGLNHTRTKLYGITHNPWDLDRNPGGSSGGSAAAVAGGVCTIATAGDGGGSTRIPAGHTGLPGLKPTYGRIPKGPWMSMNNLTAVSGCVSRSIRDVARYLDVVNGFDPRDPFSLQRVEGYERDLGTYDVSGLRVAISPDLFGAATVHSAVAALVAEQAELLLADAGLRRVEPVDVRIPEGSLEWALGGMGRIAEQLAGRWPECADQLTPQIRFGLEMAEQHFAFAMTGRIDTQRSESNEQMASLFDQADIVICATNPDVALPAAGPFPTEVDGQEVTLANQGALTIPANFYGNPSISVPCGQIDGLPVGMQVMAPHFREDWLLDLAATVERERPWPLVAPSSPC